MQSRTAKNLTKISPPWQALTLCVRLLVTACVCMAMTTRAAPVPRITVRKKAGDANPVLALEHFSGPAEVRAILLRTLRAADWFTVTTDGRAAAYRLRARFRSSPVPHLDLQIAGNGEQGRIRVRGRSGGEVRHLIHRSVDQLIQRIFDRPGPCEARLAFTIRKEGRREIFVSDFDGSHARRFTHNGSISTEPAWGRGGRFLAYTLYRRDRTEVILVDVAGGRQRRLTGFPGLNSAPDLSPDGQRMALCMSRDRRMDLYVMRLSDRAITRLTRDEAVESSPCWSPDGRAICYVSDRRGRPQLYVRDLTTGKSRRLLANPSEAVSPDWSSVSNRICFATRRRGHYVLAMIDPDAPGSQATVFMDRPGDWESPSWAPDGRHVICTHASGNGRELCIVDSRHGTVIPLTRPADLSLPAWSGRLAR